MSPHGYDRSFTQLRRIIIALLCFCLDRLSTIITDKHWLFFSAINYCVSLFIPTSRLVHTVNAFFVFLVALATGHNLIAAIIFLIFTAFGTFLLKPTLSDTVPVSIAFITFYVWFYSLLTGAGGLWTFWELVANMIIIYVLFNLTQKRRAIA